jgi:hypothetical protein
MYSTDKYSGKMKQRYLFIILLFYLFIYYLLIYRKHTV